MEPADEARGAQVRRVTLLAVALGACLLGACVHLPPRISSRDALSPDENVVLGNLAFKDGALKEAETYFRKALKASPHHPGADNNLAMVILARDGSLPEAEALAKDALRQPGTLRPYILDTLANIYLRERRYAEAAAAVQQAEAAAPADDRSVRDGLLATRRSIDAAEEKNKGAR